VLEFGCGRGRFLQHLRGHVAKPVGLDLNPEAVAQVREQGFEASNASLEQFASEHTAAFDAVCAFHTIEHLPSVPEFLSPAQRCLTPGGRILISVPNRRRLVRRNDEPLDCPPHHISRWEAPQFEYIARRFSMELVSVTFEEPDFTAIAERWLQRGRRVFVPIAGERRGEWLARAYRKLTMGQRIYNASARVRRFTRGGQFGHAMLAVFRSR
jgi:SAM-dependent methyltransferase